MSFVTAMMVVAIVLIVMLSRVMRERYRALDRMHDGSPHLQSADTMRAQDEVRQLKERIAVLERVITDNHGRADLERQIEELRDR